MSEIDSREIEILKRITGPGVDGWTEYFGEVPDGISVDLSCVRSGVVRISRGFDDGVTVPVDALLRLAEIISDLRRRGDSA